MNKSITVGMDMGDKNHRICVIGEDGEIIAKHDVTNTVKAIRKHFEGYEPCLIALEAGTHSAWVSRELEMLGHEVLVGNPRKLRVIWDSDEKDDDRDAESACSGHTAGLVLFLRQWMRCCDLTFAAALPDCNCHTHTYSNYHAHTHSDCHAHGHGDGHAHSDTYFDLHTHTNC